MRSWVDLDRVVFSGYLEPLAQVQSASASIQWNEAISLRRAHNGAHLIGYTSEDYYSNSSWYNNSGISYAGAGRLSSSPFGNFQSYSNNSIRIKLPTWSAAANPAYSADSSPVFHSLPYSAYIGSTLPADFGVAFHYPENTMSRGDKLIVSAGVEEWEIMDRANNATVATGASPLFLARVV